MLNKEKLIGETFRVKAANENMAKSSELEQNDYRDVAVKSCLRAKGVA